MAQDDHKTIQERPKTVPKGSQRLQETANIAPRLAEDGGLGGAGMAPFWQGNVPDFGLAFWPLAQDPRTFIAFAFFLVQILICL